MKPHGFAATLLLGGASLALLPAAPADASSPVYVCKGERIEKGTSTWGYARPAGSDIRIETTSESRGFARSRSSDKWAIESFGGSTLGYRVGSRIEKSNGETWTTVEEARRFAECDDTVAAALWVLDKNGKL
jgi:hypothetical protein